MDNIQVSGFTCIGLTKTIHLKNVYITGPFMQWNKMQWEKNRMKYNTIKNNVMHYKNEQENQKANKTLNLEKK